MRSGFNNLTISMVGSILNYGSFVYISYLFGAKTETDIFLFAVSLITLFASLITTVFSSFFLPIYIQLRHQSQEGFEARQFASAFFSWILMIVLIVGVIFLLFSFDIFSWASKFSPEKIQGSRHILNYFAFIFILIVINEYFRILLQSIGKFSAPAISIVIQPAITIACMYALSKTFYIESLAIAVLSSRIIQCFYLYIYLNKCGIRLHVTYKRNEHIHKFLGNVYVYWISSVVTIFSIFFFDYSATGLAGGSLTAIAYSQRIYLLPINILAIPILEIISTKFSELYVRNEQNALRQLYEKIVGISVFTMVPVSAILAAFSNEIVQVLFARGAFTQHDAGITATCLSIYAIAIPFIVIFSVNGRITLTLHKAKLPSVIGMLCHLAMIFSTWILVDKLNYIGIPVARTGAEIILFFPFGFLCVYYYFGGIRFGAIALESMKTILVAAACALSIRFFVSPLLHGYISSTFLVLTISILMFMFLYYVSCKFAGVKSLALIEEKITAVLVSKNLAVLKEL